MNDEDCGGFREQVTIVFSEPIQRAEQIQTCSHQRLLTTRATNKRVNDNEFGAVLLHELDELGVALKLPVGLDQAVWSADRKVNLLQLFLELDQRLITVQQDRTGPCSTGT
jgi:hypothetical protein